MVAKFFRTASFIRMRNRIACPDRGVFGVTLTGRAAAIEFIDFDRALALNLVRNYCFMIVHSES